MLKKTLELISKMKPGTYVPDHQVCYDEDEIRSLGVTLQRLIYSPSQIRKKLQSYGVTIIPSNFYSEIPTLDEIAESFSPEVKPPSYDLIFDNTTLRRTLVSMSEFADEFNPTTDLVRDTAFHWNNSQFSYSDALSYYCMVRLYKPKKIVEIGSGFSTLVALEATKRNGFGDIICVEPYPRDFLREVNVNLITKKVQHLDNYFFNEQLSSNGDMLFIDSTHTVKHGSDCLKIYLGILPELKNDVIVHAHDIFLPRTLGYEQMRDEQIFWTEQYLLYAYLLHNKRAEVLYGSSICLIRMREELTRFMSGKRGPGGGSLWFSQRGSQS